MASAMHLMKKMEINSGMKGVVGVLVNTGVGFGASYGLGQLYHRHNDKWYGKQAPRIAGAVGKLGAIALSMASGGNATWPGGMLDAIGQAGVNAMGLEMGLRHARKATGKKAVLIPATAALPAGASEMTSMGALGKAQPGRGLSWDQIEELAAGH